MTPAAFRKLALSMPGAVELPHFERTSFRVAKKIFATMTADGSEGMIPVRPLTRCYALLEADPEVFIEYGGWTRRFGSLGMRLRMVDPKVVAELMRDAWVRVAAKPPSARRPQPKKRAPRT